MYEICGFSGEQPVHETETKEIRGCSFALIFALSCICGILVFGISFKTVIFGGLILILHNISLEDYQIHIIRNRNIIAIVLLWLVSIIINRSDILAGILSALVCNAFILATLLLGRIIPGRRKLGGGDIKLITVISLFLTADTALIFMLLICLLGIMTAFAAGKKGQFPLGPAISAAAVISVCTDIL